MSRAAHKLNMDIKISSVDVNNARTPKQGEVSDLIRFMFAQRKIIVLLFMSLYIKRQWHVHYDYLSISQYYEISRVQKYRHVEASLCSFYFIKSS